VPPQPVGSPKIVRDSVFWRETVIHERRVPP